jgi:hypothetical protein
MPNDSPHELSYPLDRQEVPDEILAWRKLIYAMCKEIGVEIYIHITQCKNHDMYSFYWGPRSKTGTDMPTRDEYRAVFKAFKLSLPTWPKNLEKPPVIYLEKPPVIYR